ncbi:MAG: hypothetical protein J6K17_06440 [Oscillospiraceae bacterium]|nr:hypothetical protein [Oscillospiraceae bacterium]
MFNKIDNYFDLKHKIKAMIGAVVFAIVWMILWDMFPMQFYSLFCANFTGNVIQLIALNTVVTLVFMPLFTVITKTDLSFCKLVPLNIICTLAIEFLRLFINFYGWSMYLLIAAILVHGAVCLWAFATAPIRDNKAPKGMRAPAPKKEAAIKKQPLIAVIWAVTFAFSIDMVCLWLYRVMALIYYPEMA